jgi:hypothetical protein
LGRTIILHFLKPAMSELSKIPSGKARFVENQRAVAQRLVFKADEVRARIAKGGLSAERKKKLVARARGIEKAAAEAWDDAEKVEKGLAAEQKEGIKRRLGERNEKRSKKKSAPAAAVAPPPLPQVVASVPVLAVPPAAAPNPFVPLNNNLPVNVVAVRRKGQPAAVPSTNFAPPAPFFLPNELPEINAYLAAGAPPLITNVPPPPSKSRFKTTAKNAEMSAVKERKKRNRSESKSQPAKKAKKSKAKNPCENGRRKITYYRKC